MAASPTTPGGIPFDRTLSLALDRLIIALDASPSAPRRFLLRMHKRWLERHIPPGYLVQKAGPR